MQKTYLPDLSFQSRNWRFRTVRPPFLLLFVPCAEVQKPVFVTYLRPDCFLFRFCPLAERCFSPSLPYALFSLLSHQRSSVEYSLRLGNGSASSLYRLTIFTEASVNILQSLWSNATAALEYCSDGLGAMLQQPRRNLTDRLRNARKSRAAWLEVPYEGVLD